MRTHGGIAEILRCKQMPGVTGTRDSFGIGKEFTDVKTGKVIDNYKSWEKAGFSNNIDTKVSKHFNTGNMEQMHKEYTKDAKKKTKLNPKHVMW